MNRPARYNFRVYQGQTWVEPIQLRNADGTDMNLTGYQARMQVRDEISAAVVVLDLNAANGRLVVVNPAEGRLEIRVTAADMAALPCDNDWQVWVYDLELFIPEDPTPPGAAEYVQRVMEGMVVAFPEVTRA